MPKEVMYRHSFPVHITHWVNALVLLVLLMSGLQIFNAHPALYIGAKSDFSDPIMAMGPVQEGNSVKGVTTLFGWQFDTTGVFGLSGDENSGYDSRGFPWSATLPGHRDLAMGRRWHFFFAWLFLFNGLAYLLWSLGSGHLRRDLAPHQRPQAHRRIDRRTCATRIPEGRSGQALQLLQKLTYLFVALILLPLMLVTGLAMSPGMDAAFPILLDVLGGRQTARTIHFISASFIVIFVAVHLIMVLVSASGTISAR